MTRFDTTANLETALAGAEYLSDRGLATALFLSLDLGKPLLLEGEAGVGKTEAAKALASVTQSTLIRLQCYEGLDVAHAVYEWNYSRQTGTSAPRRRGRCRSRSCSARTS